MLSKLFDLGLDPRTPDSTIYLFPPPPSMPLFRVLWLTLCSPFLCFLFQRMGRLLCNWQEVWVGKERQHSILSKVAKHNFPSLPHPQPSNNSFLTYSAHIKFGYEGYEQRRETKVQKKVGY